MDDSQLSVACARERKSEIDDEGQGTSQVGVVSGGVVEQVMLGLGLGLGLGLSIRSASGSLLELALRSGEQCCCSNHKIPVTLQLVESGLHIGYAVHAAS